MEMIGLDLHKRETQLCMRAENGALVERRIATTRERFTAELGERPRARILLEASTESEWVAQHLESLGHEVIVADPNFAPMYATRTRRTKTDRRDARALLTAVEVGAYRPAYRTSAARRHVRAALAVRDTLVRARARCVILAKTLTRRDGLRVRSSTAERAMARLQALELSPRLAEALAPLATVVAPLTAEIHAADQRLAALVATDADVARLTTVPGIGPVTANAVVATVDDIRRFPSAHQFAAYFGLVPSEQSSGERRVRGAITKTGNTRVRWLLIEAAWHVLCRKDPATDALRTWGRRLASRRGTRVAVVAVARRLAGILFAMWRDGVAYDPTKLSRSSSRSRSQGGPGPST
jgi:transposase